MPGAGSRVEPPEYVTGLRPGACAIAFWLPRRHLGGWVRRWIQSADGAIRRERASLPSRRHPLDRARTSSRRRGPVALRIPLNPAAEYVLFVHRWRLDQFDNLTTHHDKRDAPPSKRHIRNWFNNCPCACRLKLGQCQRELAYLECGMNECALRVPLQKRIQWRGLTHGLQQLDGRSFTRQEHLTNALSGVLNERPTREPTVQCPHLDEESFDARDSHPDMVQDESTFQSRLLLASCSPCVTSDPLASAAIIPPFKADQNHHRG